MEGEGIDSVYDFVVDDPLYLTDLAPSLAIGGNNYRWDIFPPYNTIIDDIETSNLYNIWNRKAYTPTSNVYGEYEEIIQNNLTAQCNNNTFNVNGRFNNNPNG